jgi:hypothetical protein
VSEPSGPSGPPTLHTDYVVDDACPRRIAVEFTRYRLMRPSFLILTLVEVVLVVLFLAISQWILAVVFVVFILLVTVSSFATVRRTERLLSTRGYRPGSTVAVDYYDDRLVVTTAVAIAPYQYRELRGISERNGIVTVRTVSRNLIILLPAPLVPEQVRPMLAATAN